MAGELGRRQVKLKASLAAAFGGLFAFTARLAAANFDPVLALRARASRRPPKLQPPAATAGATVALWPVRGDAFVRRRGQRAKNELNLNRLARLRIDHKPSGAVRIRRCGPLEVLCSLVCLFVYPLASPPARQPASPAQFDGKFAKHFETLTGGASAEANWRIRSNLRCRRLESPSASSVVWLPVRKFSPRRRMVAGEQNGLQLLDALAERASSSSAAAELASAKTNAQSAPNSAQIAQNHENAAKSSSSTFNALEREREHERVSPKPKLAGRQLDDNNLPLQPAHNNWHWLHYGNAAHATKLADYTHRLDGAWHSDELRERPDTREITQLRQRQLLRLFADRFAHLPNAMLKTRAAAAALVDHQNTTTTTHPNSTSAHLAGGNALANAPLKRPNRTDAPSPPPPPPTSFDHLAQLSCDSGEMVIQLNFTEPFRGIVYPEHNRLSACRFFGDGHLNYELRLPLRGCGTKQVSRLDFRSRSRSQLSATLPPSGRHRPPTIDFAARFGLRLAARIHFLAAHFRADRPTGRLAPKLARNSRRFSPGAMNHFRSRQIDWRRRQRPEAAIAHAGFKLKRARLLHPPGANCIGSAPGGAKLAHWTLAARITAGAALGGLDGR